MSETIVNPAPADHVTIELDGVTMFAPKGSMIIQSADKAGIAIPRFCYHEKLPIAANCRMCMVEVEMGGRPMPKPQPACATPVADGMKIFTQSQRALSAQRNVMEFLLINHPLDCPICDQGGECELQDLSLGFGRSVSRFVERKRVVADEDLGPLVATEMTRCIHCTRCVRVMSEVAGTYELGGLGRGESLQIGTYVGKPLMSELSGNVIDVCPVGALTNKPFRFRARAWELLARESIGYHDALGSNIWLHTRRGEVLRTVPRDNEAINECWVSDRDRYSYQGVYAADRATRPLVKRNGVWSEVEWDEALRVASEALKRSAGADLGALVHGSTSSEEGHLLARLTRGLGSESIDHRLRQMDFADAATAMQFEMPVAEIEKAEVVVLVGCNPRSELPLLNARLRKAVQHGAQIHVISSLDMDLTYPLASKHISAPQHLLGSVLGMVKSADAAGLLPASTELAQAAAEHKVSAKAESMLASLATAKNAVFIVGEMVTGHVEASWLRAAIRHLAHATGSACNEIPIAANALGLNRVGVLPGATGLDARAQISQPRKTYLLYGIESACDLAGGAQAWATMAKAGNVVAFAAFASDELKQIAQVILPIGLLPEIDASLTNVDGIEQVVDAGSKLPGDARAGWKVLRALGAALALHGFTFTTVDEVRAEIASLTMPDPAADKALPARAGSVSGLSRIDTMASYRADGVLRRAAALAAHPLVRGACVVLNAEDGKAIGISGGESVRIGDVVLPAWLSSEVPVGGAWIESGYAETSQLPPSGAPLQIARA